MRQILDRAVALQAASPQGLTFEHAVTQALDDSTARVLRRAGVDPKLEIVDPASQPELSSAAIAAQLNGTAGIAPARIETALAPLAPERRAVLRELLAQQSEIYSTRRIANELRALHGEIASLASANGGDPRSVYYYLAQNNKSYGMMAMAHRSATGTPPERYIDGPLQLKDMVSRGLLGDRSTIVVLDDVAGTGLSLFRANEGILAAGYAGRVVIAPMLSTTSAAQLSRERTGAMYKPGCVVEPFARTAYYENLSPNERDLLRGTLGKAQSLGFDENGLSVAFPHMAPDNNNHFFGDRIAPSYLLNESRSASKTNSWPQKNPEAS